MHNSFKSHFNYNKQLCSLLIVGLLILISLFPKDSFAQLSGLGVEFNSGSTLSSLSTNSFGLDATHEIGGCYFSIKNIIGVKRSVGAIQNESINNINKINLIRHQFQVKYWFGNMIRARKIYPFRCAHRIMITEDYHFKPYLLMGIDNGLDLEKNNSNRHQLNGVFGIGANIRKFGTIYSARLLFVEIRSLTLINKPVENHSNQPFNRMGIEGVIGIKFY